jgi:hypothetical protein
LVSRGVFELNNRTQVNSILDNRWYAENKDTPKPLSYMLQCERLADEWTKVSGYLVERAVLENPDQHLTMIMDKGKNEDILRQAYVLNSTGNELLQETLQSEQIKDLPSKMQKSVATQLVEYSLQYGQDVNVTFWKFDSMKESAKLEDESAKMIQHKVEQALLPSTQDHNNSTTTGSAKEHKEVITEGYKLVVHHLRRDLHEQMFNLHYQSAQRMGHQVYCNSLINKSIKQITNIQLKTQQEHQRHLEQHQQIRGMGMEM